MNRLNALHALSEMALAYVPHSDDPLTARLTAYDSIKHLAMACDLAEEAEAARAAGEAIRAADNAQQEAAEEEARFLELFYTASGDNGKDGAQ